MIYTDLQSGSIWTYPSKTCSAVENLFGDQENNKDDNETMQKNMTKECIFKYDIKIHRVQM